MRDFVDHLAKDRGVKAVAFYSEGDKEEGTLENTKVIKGGGT